MIYRDLTALEEMGIAIDRPSTGSSRYSLRENYLPKLTPDSATAVYASTLLYRDTLLDEAMARARTEIEKSFFKNNPERSRLLRERIHIVGDTLAHPEEFGDTLGLLMRAVCDSFCLRVVYIDNQGVRADRLLEPYGLVYKRGVWYLIARRRDDGEVRTYRVDQMALLYPREEEKFAYPEDFKVAEHVGDSWGVYHNDDVTAVRLRFSRRVAHRVKNLRYHQSQRIIGEEEDGSLLVEFRVCGLMELASWVLQWGTEVEVVEPASLRESVAETARRIAEINGK